MNVYVVCMTDGDHGISKNICSTKVFSSRKKAVDYIIKNTNTNRGNNSPSKSLKSHKSINYRGNKVIHWTGNNKGTILYMDQDQFPISTKHFVIKSSTVK